MSLFNAFHALHYLNQVYIFHLLVSAIDVHIRLCPDTPVTTHYNHKYKVVMSPGLIIEPFNAEGHFKGKFRCLNRRACRYN
jgi:hypothetical protein